MQKIGPIIPFQGLDINVKPENNESLIPGNSLSVEAEEYLLGHYRRNLAWNCREFMVRKLSLSQVIN